MPDFRRWYVPGGTYFFTLVTEGRVPLLTDERARNIQRTKLQECGDKWPFTLDAIVLLSDPLQELWTLPDGDGRYSMRWGWIKKEFSKEWLIQGGIQQPVSEAEQRERRLGVWQPRFWEHLIRDVHDMERHLDYIHFN